MIFTREQKKQAYERLSPEVQDLIMDNETTELIAKYLNEVSLYPEQIDPADSEIFYAMHGLQTLTQAINNIAIISNKSVESLTGLKSKLEDRIFSKIREYGGISEEEPDVVQTEKFRHIALDETSKRKIRETAQKYSLNELQTERLMNLVGSDIIRVGGSGKFLEKIISELSVSRILAEQIYGDLDKRVFEYVLDLIEREKEEKEESVKVPSVKVESDIKEQTFKPISKVTPEPSMVKTQSYTTPPKPQTKQSKKTERSFAGRYNRLMKITPDEYWNLYEALPEILRVIFVSSELSSEIDEIAKTNRLNEDQTNGLVLLIGDIILDIHDDGELDTLIQKNLGIDSYLSKKITFSLKNRITENIEGMYKKIQSDIEREDIKAKEKTPVEVTPTVRPQPVPPPKPKIPTYTPPPPIQKPEYVSNFRPITTPPPSAPTPAPAPAPTLTPTPAPTPKPEPTPFPPKAPQQIPVVKDDGFTEEALSRPLGQSIGSRPFGALKNYEPKPEEEGFQKSLGGEMTSRIVFGKTNNDINNAQKPESFIDRLEDIGDNMGRQRYSTEPVQKEEPIVNTFLNTQQSTQQTEKPAFIPKFGDVSFNDPLKEQPSTAETLDAKRLKEIYDKINRDSSLESVEPEIPIQKVAPTVQTPPTHEYVVDPYREPVE